VMIAGVLGGVFIAHTLYQIVLSYGASGLEVRFSYAFMSPDPVSPDPVSQLRHRQGGKRRCRVDAYRRVHKVRWLFPSKDRPGRSRRYPNHQIAQKLMHHFYLQEARRASVHHLALRESLQKTEEAIESMNHFQVAGFHAPLSKRHRDK